ncbi:hypothetical protein NDU88_000478 [Pleurodeles waltl]|uniref:Uncharacterized protein n=1 Tax=Pleurodeles waltl TaxID=8319 RepID=A0AAV7THD5_PLEWA|nr:hypothetical protein NDU88_000478 [Pleurodeles waltl]
MAIAGPQTVPYLPVEFTHKLHCDLNETILLWFQLSAHEANRRVPVGTPEGAPCLRKHVHLEEEATCAGKDRVKEGAASVEKDTGGDKTPEEPRKMPQEWRRTQRDEGKEKKTEDQRKRHLKSQRESVHQRRKERSTGTRKPGILALDGTSRHVLLHNNGLP